MINKEGYLVIQFDDSDDLSIDALVSGIENLDPPPVEDKRVVEEPEEAPLMLSDLSGGDKKKKKKKKKSRWDTLISEEASEDDISLLELNIDSIEDSEYKSSRELIHEGKRGYKKAKNDPNEYKKEFAEELTILYALLEETDKFGKSLEKKWKVLDEQKTRGVSKFMTELAQSNLSAKSAKLAIVKEIASIKKTIADLKIKKDKDDSKNKEESGNNEALANRYFSQIMKHGRADFIETLNTPTTFGVDNFNADDYRAAAMDIMDDDIESIVAERISAGEYSRSTAGDKYIEYENRGVKIYVNKCIDTGEWEFIAIDRYGERIDDYPLPSKRDAGRMRFSEDGTYATDSRGRQYSVKEYWADELSDDEDDDDSYSSIREYDY